MLAAMAAIASGFASFAASCPFLASCLAVSTCCWLQAASDN